MKPSPDQQSLPLGRTPRRPKKKATHGGRRAGAGRPRKHPLPAGWKPGRRFVPHLRRDKIDRHKPAHVTLRLLPVARTLRSRKLFAAIHGALAASRERPGFRLVEFSVQRDHLHLIVEASDRRSLSRGMQGLSVRIAQRLNEALARSGRIFADRYHARVLGTPTEVKRALLYVLNNARRHAAQGRAFYPPGWLDPYSSAADFDGWRQPPRRDPDLVYLPRCTAAPRSWLLGSGWRRAGLLEIDATPGDVAPPAHAPI